METFLRRNFKVKGNIVSLYKPLDTQYSKLLAGIEVKLWHRAPMAKIFLGSALTDDQGDFVVEFEADSPAVYINDGKINDVFLEAYYNGVKLDEPAAPDLLKGLMAYWKLDETTGTGAADATGNGHEGALLGDTVPTWAAGKIDNGLQFNDDGSGTVSSYMSVHSDEAFPFGTGDFTIAFWIKTDSTIGSGSEFVYVLDSSGGVLEKAFSLYFTGSALNFEAGSFGYYKPATLSVGVWKHLVVRRIGHQLDCIMNGVSLGKESCQEIISCPQPTFMFGNMIDGHYNFDGMLDEIGIWKGHGLTDEEIALLYNNGTGRQYPFANL